MVIAVEDIVDEDSLKAWLNELPKETRHHSASFLASRAAARVLPPAWIAAYFDREFTKAYLTPNPLLRCVLLALIATHDNKLLGNPDHVAWRSISYVDEALTSTEYSGYHISLSAVQDAADVASSDSLKDAMDELVEGTVFFANGPFFQAHLRDLLQAAFLSDCKAMSVHFLNFNSERVDLVLPLWPDINPLAQEWHGLKDKLIDDAELDGPHSWDWSFWIDWYEGLLEGRAQNIDMLLEIATTDKIDWEAPPREVNEAIAEIVERYGPQTKLNQTKITQSQIQRTKSAIQENKNALPPTLECIEFLIANEIQRLQQKNYANDIEMEESKRLISVFMQLLNETRTLSSKVVLDEIGDDEATEVISTLGVYKKLMADWPRDNAPEVVDGVYRIGLVGSVTGVFVMCGLPAPVGAAVAGAAFGGKKLAEIANTLIKGSGT